VAAVTVYSAPEDGRKGRPKHVEHTYSCLLHPNSWQTPVATVTVYSAPDDGRKGRPKHAERTCSC